MSKFYELGEIENAVEIYKRPETYKKTDMAEVEDGIKWAMQDPNFNLKHVRDSKQSALIADIQFRQLVRSMDKSHN